MSLKRNTEWVYKVYWKGEEAWMTEGDLSITRVRRVKSVCDYQEKSEGAKFQAYGAITWFEEYHLISIMPQVAANTPMSL